jgi:pimeloyl-ACP methyl ester carboxylesterase
MQKPRLTLITSAFLLVGMLVPLQSQEKTEIGKFRDADCPFPLPDGVVPGENFKFGYVSVPELHSDPGGKSIELAVAIFPSTSEIHQPDPLVMNTSGPGKSNMDNFIPDIAGALGAYLLPQRDIVIIELRGLRYSRPFLSLDEVREAKMAIMDKNLSKEETMDVLRKAMQDSRNRFEAEGVNLSAYNNVETAADIALVMKHLGYEKFNIVGSSAGTMVAHHVIRDYPERIRCGVMDAGLPLDQDILINYVPNVVNSLKNYFKECRNEPDCAAAFPDLESRFLSLLASLNEDPLMLKLTDPVSGKKISYALNGYRLSENLFSQMFYSTQVPLLIHQVLEGDYGWLIDQVQYSLVPNYFADGLGLTVFITESGNYTRSDIDYDPAYQIFSDGISISGIGGEYFLETNKLWKLKKLELERVHYPQPRDVPVMVVNGKYDPVIPVKYDELMRKDLNNAYIYRFDGVPHSAFDNATPCVLPMLMQFLNDASTAPDNSCMENFKQVYRLQ